MPQRPNQAKRAKELAAWMTFASAMLATDGASPSASSNHTRCTAWTSSSENFPRWKAARRNGSPAVHIQTKARPPIAKTSGKTRARDAAMLKLSLRASICEKCGSITVPIAMPAACIAA